MTNPQTAPLKVAYNTGEFPRATDTFIAREVQGVRAAGVEVITCSIRKTDAAHHVGTEQAKAAAETFAVLENAKNPVRLLKSHFRALTTSPGRYLSALGLALTTGAPGVKGLLYQLFYFAEAGVLAYHLVGEGATHLHNHFGDSSCSVSMLASAISGIPFSVTLHGPAMFYEPKIWRLDKKIERARFVSCISHFCRSQAMVFSDQSHWDKLHIVHCGVEPARYSGEKPAREDGQVRLLFVGRLAGVKGVPVLLESMQALLAKGEAPHLTLVGDGPDREALERAVAEGGLTEHVSFLGYKSQSEVAEILQASDILVLPSFAEGLPVTLMEALAAAVPVVTTRIAGVAELVIDGEAGLLVPPGDATALTDAIARLSGDPALRDRMGQAGRQIVAREFDIAVEASRLAGLFRAYREASPGLPIRPAAGDPSVADARDVTPPTA